MVAGFAKVEAALAQEDAAALLHASDGAPDGVRKLNGVLRRANEEDGDGRKPVAVLNAFTSSQLDLAIGRSNVVHAALLGGPESKAFLTRATRLDRFRTGTTASKPLKKPEKWEGSESTKRLRKTIVSLVQDAHVKPRAARRGVRRASARPHKSVASKGPQRTRARPGRAPAARCRRLSSAPDAPAAKQQPTQPRPRRPRGRPASCCIL